VLLGLCLMLGTLTPPGPNTSFSGAPIHSVVRALRPIVLKQTASQQRFVLLRLINESRSRAGLNPLQWDDRLAQAADEHARIMSVRGELSHKFPAEPDLANRLASRLRFEQAGENVFYDASIEDAHQAFMDSPHHRDNILNGSYDSVGIGVIAEHSVFYIVEDFAHRVPELNNDMAAERVAQQFINLRQSAGGNRLTLVNDGRVQQMACSMAERETVDAHSSSLPLGVRFTAAYATADPDQVPAEVARLATLSGVREFSVGACYARTPKYPTGLYWVSILLFRNDFTLSLQNSHPF
jgi:uncharacterized protein YkwD